MSVTHDDSDSGCATCGACLHHDDCDDGRYPTDPDNCQACGACSDCIAECKSRRAENHDQAEPVTLTRQQYIDAIVEAKRTGAARALRAEAARGRVAAAQAKAKMDGFMPEVLSPFAHRLMLGLSEELDRRAIAIESGEVTL